MDMAGEYLEEHWIWNVEMLGSIGKKVANICIVCLFQS